MSTRLSPASIRTGCMAPLMLAFLEPPKRLPASVTNIPSSRMWTRICPTSKVVPVAKSANPPLVEKPIIASPASLRFVYPLSHAIPECFGEHAGTFEEAVDGGVARKSLDERQAGLGVLLAGLEEWLEQHQVRHQVNQRVS